MESKMAILARLGRFVAAAGILAAMSAVVMLSGCKRDLIIYATSDYYMEIVFGEGEKWNLSSSNLPRMWAVGSYVDGKQSYEMYLTPSQHPSDMPFGGYLVGLSAGPQTLLAYNYDVNSLHFDMTSNLEKLRVYTDVLDYSNGVAVVRAPSPLYVYRETRSIPFITEGEGTYMIKAVMTEETETWTVIVRGVRATQNIATVDFFLSGQQRGYFLGKDEEWDERAIIYFTGQLVDASWSTRAEGDQEIVAEYSTFGRQSSIDRALLTVRITGTNGYQYFIQKDVTDIVADPAGEGFTIYVDGSEVEVAEKKDGGFDPNAEEWQPDVTEITLQ